MKNCTHCGAENIDGNCHCSQCAALLSGEPIRFALWPQSATEWTRSLALGLLMGCFTGWFFILWVDDRAWRYLEESVGHTLLPLLGLSLFLFCILGSTLPK